MLKGPLSSLTRLLRGALCGTHSPAGKPLKPYHLTCVGLNSQEERGRERGRGEAVGEQGRRRRKKESE